MPQSETIPVTVTTEITQEPVVQEEPSEDGITETPEPDNLKDEAPTEEKFTEKTQAPLTETQAPVNSPMPHGVVPDQVQVNQALAQASNDLETLRARFQRNLGHFDWSTLNKHLVNAQEWINRELGI